MQIETQTIEQPLWLQILAAEAKATSRAEVARKLEYSRTTVALCLDGKYVGNTHKVEQKVLQVLGKVACPFLKTEIKRSECLDFCQTSAPTHNPSRMHHWRACQTCQYKQGGSK
jgi:hypothetical protein